ncbi:MAG: DUF2829 domain-containing protein [Cetobacterium sp.]
MKFLTRKVVTVEEMSRKEYVSLRGWSLPDDEKHLAEERVYKIIYEDGYVSMCPKDIFFKDARELSKMTFGDALEILKKGYKVARKGWNGKGMFVFMDCSQEYDNYKKFTGKTFNIVNPHFLIKNVDESLSTWVPSVNDCLAEDWEVIE